MTLIYDSGRGDAPSTHVLAIGVGNYPHLLGGNSQLAINPMGLKQLESPPVSLKAFLEWFLNPIIAPGGLGFINEDAPLGTIHALASVSPNMIMRNDTGPIELDSAKKENIDEAFTAWLEVLKANDSNIGVFYFCGHGVMVSDHYLLAEDFGRTLQPWSKAFDISSTIRAVERETKGALYFFLDACREVSRELALSIGANPQALMEADLTKKVSRMSSVCISATGEGEQAFAPNGRQVSHFTKALLKALSGFAGNKRNGTAMWDVDGENLGSTIRKILEYEFEKRIHNGKNQVCEQLINGRSIPLIQLLTPPKVAVEVNYVPENMRACFEISVKSPKIHLTQIKENKLFEVEVPMGMYTVCAIDPDGQHNSDIREDEELRPPYYILELGA